MFLFEPDLMNLIIRADISLIKREATFTQKHHIRRVLFVLVMHKVTNRNLL